MACRIAENQPLSALREDLGIAKQCHSVRAQCVQGYKRVGGDYAMGVPGAALGYCQALFSPRENPRLHTEYVRGCLAGC